MARGDTRGPREFYSGRLSESDMFGDFQTTPEGVKAFKVVAGERGYIARGQAIELIRKHTKEDPTNPTKPFANEIRLAVAEELGLEDDEDLDRLRFYSAVGTPLDVFHGVDGWIEFHMEGGASRIVTMDVTLDPGKTEHKADVIVHAVPDPSENEKQFMELVYEEYAPQIADKLRSSVEAMMRRRERQQNQSAAK